MKFRALVCLLLFLGQLPLAAAPEPQGVVIYQEPATTFTEAIEYRFFRQDNALNSTLITSNGEQKKLKSGGVLGLVPYPPLSFDSAFPSAAETTRSKIAAMEKEYPLVRSDLEKVLARWDRALSAFQQSQKPRAAGARPRDNAPSSLTVREGTFAEPHISSATPETVTVTHATGVTKLPIGELTAAQVVSLNRTSQTVQLPLGITLPPPPSAAASRESATTHQIEAIGGTAVEFLADRFEVSTVTIRIWSLFVILPALVLLLVLGLILSLRRSR